MCTDAELQKKEIRDLLLIYCRQDMFGSQETESGREKLSNTENTLIRRIP